MNFRIVIVIIAVPIIAAAFAWSTAWYVRSTMSQDPRVRRRAWVADILISLSTFTLCVATAPPNSKQRYAYLLVLGLIAAVWLFRGLRLLLQKRKHA